MKKKPYRYEIKANGDWVYFVRNKPCDVYDYRRAVEAHEFALKQEQAREREERLAKPLGTYIEKHFSSTVYLKQLAVSPQAYARKDPACGVNSYRELERKAKSTGQVVNAYEHDDA